MTATYYTYDSATKRLCVAPKAITVTRKGRDGKERTYMTVNAPALDYAAIGAYIRADDPAPGAPDGMVAVADGWEVRDGAWHRTWTFKPAPEPEPRTFSKLKIVAALKEAGVWEEVKRLVESSGLYDYFLAAQDLREDNEEFQKGKTALAGTLGWTDDDVEALLAECVAGSL